jgi:hypothetical protein
VCVAPFLVGGATMTASSEWLMRGGVSPAD